MTNKLLLYMVDGVAAEHYEADRTRFPNFYALEQRGFRVKNLHSVALGTSFPGRTGMLTGVSADVSGVYGNYIWGGENFRYASPDDVAVPTIPQRAKEAGMTVACLGAGMVRFEDAHTVVPPWWIEGEVVQRARDTTPQQGGEAWLKVADAPVTDRFQKACDAFGIPTTYTDLPEDTQLYLRALVHDQRIADWVSAMAIADDAPDVIWAEFLATDTIQHYSGYKSDLAQESVAQADMALGKIIGHLSRVGTLDEWNIAVMSDHGHSVVETCIFANVVLPGVKIAPEGCSLLVATDDTAELDRVTQTLAEYDVEPFSNECVPPQYRDTVHVFVAPPGVSFETAPEGVTDPTGVPKAISTHGLKPGLPGDDRFALFAGPDVPQGVVDEADPRQVAPTLAKLLDLDTTDYPTAALF